MDISKSFISLVASIFFNRFNRLQHRMGSDGFQNSISAVNVEDEKIINTYKLDVPPQAQGDWESMSIGPCDSKGTKSCIYIGNTGNNLAEFCLDQNCHTGRPLVYIYKLEEPDINAFNDLNSSLQVATLVVNFKKSGFPTNRANSESLFVVSAAPNIICVAKKVVQILMYALNI